MRYQVVDDVAALTGLAADWRRLHAECGGSPFQHPDLHLLWWRTLGRLGWRPHVVAGYRDGRLAVVCPLAVRRKGPVRLLRWAGEEVFDYCDVVAADGVIATGLWRFIGSGRGHDVALLRNLHPDAACRAGLTAAARTGPRREQAAFVALDAWSSGQAWLASLKSDHRSLYRRRLRQLEARGPVRFHLAGPADGPAPALEALIAHKRAWSKARNQPSVLATDEGADFFRGLPAALGGACRLSWLSCGGETVACQLGFVSGRTLAYYMAAYDQGWAALSPGRVLLTHLVMWCIDAGLAELDFLRGQESYKDQMATGHRELGEAVFASTPWGALAELAWRRRAKAPPSPAAGTPS